MSMNKEYAIQILREVEGTSPSFIREYGISIVKEAFSYIEKLYLKGEKKDKNILNLLNNVSDKLYRI